MFWALGSWKSSSSALSWPATGPPTTAATTKKSPAMIRMRLERRVTRPASLASMGASVIASGVQHIGPRALFALRPWGERARADLAVVVCEDDRCRTVADVELAEDAAHVGLHGRLGDVEAGGDLGVGRAAGDQAQHVALAIGEQLEPARIARDRRNRAAVAVEDPRR